jgi:hypothetical protein
VGVNDLVFGTQAVISRDTQRVFAGVREPSGQNGTCYWESPLPTPSRNSIGIIVRPMATSPGYVRVRRQRKSVTR